MALIPKLPFAKGSKLIYTLSIVGFIVFFIILPISIYTKIFSPIFHTNLMKFHSLTAKDPLFYDANTDLEHLRASVQTLKDSDDQIVKMNELYTKNQFNYAKWDVYPKGWRIWPDEFLTMLPMIHEATKDFLNQPTSEKAIKLLNEYTKITREYRNSIDIQIQTLETFLERFPKYKTTKIFFIGSATTPKIAHNDFLLIRKNAEKLEEEIIGRKKCLYEGVCVSKKISDQKLMQNNAVTVPFSPLPDDILGIDRKKDSVFGPFNVVTGCFGFSEDQKPYRLPFFMVEGDNKLSPILANAKYYMDNRPPKPQPANAPPWVKFGFYLRPHEVSTDYLCTDLRYLSQLFLDYLKERQESKGSLSNENLFSVFPYLIDHTEMLSQFLTFNLIYTKTPYSPLYLLINRSAYSLYFGTFTSRIWRISQSPTYLIKKDFSDKIFYAGYTTYENLVVEGISEKEIIKLNSIPDILEKYRMELQADIQSGQKN